MQLLNFFLISLICYLGVITGYVIMLLAPEEKKQGMKYFRFLLNAIFIFTIILSVYIRLDLIVILVSILAVIFFYTLEYKIHVSYLLFAILFYLLSDSSLFLVLSLAIFAYGMAAGSYVYDPRYKRKSFFRVIYLIYFLILTNLLKLVL
jgi:hypothetical protein